MANDAEDVWDRRWENVPGPYFCDYLHPVVADAIRQYDYAWPCGDEGAAHIITQDGNIEDVHIDWVWEGVEDKDHLRAACVRWLVERIRSIPEDQRILPLARELEEGDDGE